MNRSSIASAVRPAVLGLVAGLACGLSSCDRSAAVPLRAGAPGGAPGAVTVDSGQGGDRSVEARLVLPSAQIQSIAHRWVGGDVTEFDVDLAAGGQQLAEARVMTEAGQTEAIFTRLRLGVAYTLSAAALGNPGGDPSAPTQILNAANPATASVSFTGANDVNDETAVDLTIQLDDVPFSGSATTSFDTAPGSYLSPASTESGSAAQDTSGVTTVAGSIAGYLDGDGSVARFNAPYGIAVDASGDIYVADSGNRLIREIGTDGVVTTVSPYSRSQGTMPGTAISPFGFFDGLAFDGDGSLLLADSRGGLLERALPGLPPAAVVGDGQLGLSDGSDASASFDFPTGVVTQPDGSIIVADTADNCIRVVDPAGYTYTWLGGPAVGSDDGYGLAAGFDHPTGLALDAEGNLYVADTGNDTIRLVTPAGVVSTLAGSAGQFGDEDGPASQARFDGPTGLAIDVSGDLFVADTNNNTIREISPSGMVSTLAGSGYQGFADGPDGLARLDAPSGLALDGRGDLFVADTLNDKIRRVRIP